MSHSRPHLFVAASTCLAAAALVAGCSSSSTSAAGKSTAAGTNAAPTSSSASSTAQAPAGTKTITAKLSEFHIDLSTSNLTPGTYTVRAVNDGKIVHALTFDGKGVDDKSTGDIEPGKSGTVTVTLAAGKYEVYCPVGNHKMEGMDTHVQVG